MATFPRRAAIASMCVLLASFSGAPARADSAGEIARAAAQARDAEAVAELGQRLARVGASLDAAARPEPIEAIADALGRLVQRARELDLEPGSFERLIALGRDLGARAKLIRERLEESAGEDEDALERLYRSPGWQRLDYSEAMLGYWIGWAELGRGRALPPGPERRAAMGAAEAAFARSALELRLPRIAAASRLGFAVARHDLGDRDGARRALERLEPQLEASGETGLLATARYELAAIDLEQGEIERGRAVAARIPAGELSREQQLALMRREAEAWLRRAGTGQGGAGAAATLLRQLLAAGGAEADAAAALVARHWDLLEGRDVGPIGDLLAAETAYAAGRFAEARDAYARALAEPGSVPGLKPATARYRYARSLAESGRRAAAAAELEQLLTGGGGSPVRAPAAALFHALAEAIATEAPGPEAEARAQRAAEILLDADPASPGAGTARVRVARAREVREGSAAAIAELERIPRSSPSHPTARLDLARLRAAQLQQLEASGRAATPPGRRAALALAADIDAVGELIAEGRLASEPQRDAALAVFRAKAAAWSGEPAPAVLERVATAEALPGLDAAGRRTLLRLRLRVLAQAGEFAELAGLLAARSAGEIGADWEIWSEALAQLEARSAPPAVRRAWYERLEPLAPERERADLALGHARALLAAGQAEAALLRARALALADPSWGDAWILYARALDAAGSVADACEIWERIAGGVEPGSPRWVEASFAAADAARRLGDAERACRSLAALGRRADDLGERERARLADAAAASACRPATPENDSGAAPVRSAASDPPTDLR